MVKRQNKIDDLDAVLATEIEFVDDDRDRGWMVGTAGTLTAHLRMGNFPDEELWSLWLGDGRWMDFTEPPTNWIITRTAGGWPVSARPRLPKGEFYE